MNALAQTGTKNDLSPVALSMIRRAAEQNYLPAIDLLAKAYRSGGGGLVPEIKQAEMWEAKSRELRKISGDRMASANEATAFVQAA